jgi:hypothetical protein
MCEDRQKVRPIGSGAIVGTDLTLLTAAHLFFDEAGRLKHSLRCHFQNQSIPVEEVPLNLQKIDNAIFGTATPRDDQRHNDWMVVGLAYALPSVEPLRVDPGAYLAEGREVIGISAFQRGVHWVSRDEPIAQVCKLWRLRFMEGALPIMTTNCQGAPGASGSTLIAVSTPLKKCIGSPEQKYISDAGKKAPELGAFSSGIRLGWDYPPAGPSWHGVSGACSD